MIVRSATVLKNQYPEISQLAKETMEPVYITKNGKEDGVYLSIETYERREQLFALRQKVMQAENERIDGNKTMPVDEARAALKERRSMAEVIDKYTQI